MLDQLSQNWWAVALRGVAAIIFGALALAWPGLAFTALVLVFGIYALWDGVFAIVSVLTRHTGGNHRWFMLLEGVVSLITGIVTFAFPDIAGVALLYLIAAWAVVTGILELVAAIRLRREITGEWLLALGGIASVVFGIVIALFPAAGIVAVTWLIGAYAIVFGVLLLFLAFRLRSYGIERRRPPMMGTPA